MMRRTGACRRKLRDRLCCNSLKSEEIIAQRWSEFCPPNQIQTSPDLPRITIHQDIVPWRVICLSGAALHGDKSGGHKILDALAMEGGVLYN